MSQHYFSLPPLELSDAERQLWQARVHEAEYIVGIADGGVPVASKETIAMLDRYVRGELTLEQVVALQQQRFGRRF